MSGWGWGSFNSTLLRFNAVMLKFPGSQNWIFSILGSVWNSLSHTDLGYNLRILSSLAQRSGGCRDYVLYNFVLCIISLD